MTFFLVNVIHGCVGCSCSICGVGRSVSVAETVEENVLVCAAAEFLISRGHVCGCSQNIFVAALDASSLPRGHVSGPEVQDGLT